MTLYIIKKVIKDWRSLITLIIADTLICVFFPIYIIQDSYLKIVILIARFFLTL